MKLGETIRIWQTQRLARRVVNPKTSENQSRNLELFASFVGETRDISSITSDEIEAWMAELATTENKRGKLYEDSTINRIMSPVRTFFRDQHRRGRIRVDPCLDVPNIRLPTRLPKALTEHTMAKLLSGAASHRDRTLIIVAATTGLRASELSRMNVEDWDRKAETLTVTRSKTGQEQIVWIVGQTAEALTAWVDYGLGGREEGPMWPSRKYKGKALRSDSISTIVRHVAVEAEVKATAHMLRHTFLTNLANQGVPIHVLQKAAGHASMTSTQQYITTSETDVYLAMQNQIPIEP